MESKNSAYLTWIMWGIAASFVLFQFFLQISITVVVPTLKQAFVTNNAGIGFLSASFFYPYIIFQIPSGLLVEKIGPRRLLTIAIFGCMLSCVIFALANNLHVAILARLLMGFFCAPAVVSALYIAAHWLPAKRFALIAGLTEMLGMFGGAFGVNILAFLVKTIGWRYALLLCALIALGLAILAWLIIKDRTKTIIEKKSNEKYSLASFFAIFKQPQVWLSGLFAGLLFAPVITFASLWCIPYLVDSHIVALNGAALLCSLIFIGTALGVTGIGWFSDYIQRRKLLLIPGVIVSLFCMLIITYAQNISLPTIAITLFCLGFFSGVYVIPFAIVRDISPKRSQGAALAFINMVCVLLGGPLLQPVIGWIMDFGRQYELWALNICLLLGFLISLFIKETYCKT